MRKALWAIGLLFSVLCDIGFLPSVGLSGLSVLVALGFFLAITQDKGAQRALPVVGALLIEQLFSGILFGVAPLVFLLLCIIMERITQRFFREQPVWLVGLLTASGFFVYQVLIVSAQLLAGSQFDAGAIRITVFAAIAEGLLACVLFPICSWYVKILLAYGRGSGGLGTIKRHI